MPDSPYKGLMPYTEEDEPFFFGREREREIIIANLMASRLTLLYGPSGVGKSSVLRAGVASPLRSVARQNLAEYGAPEFAVVVFNAWRDDPIIGITNAIQEAVSSALGVSAQAPLPPLTHFGSVLQEWSERLGGDLLLIFDQFEEYFLYHAAEDGAGTFAEEFASVIKQPDV